MKLNDAEKKYHIELLNKHYFFDIELSSACNLNCVFCPREFIDRKRAYMDELLLNRLTEWLPSKANIMFAGMGEPLLNKNVFEVINNLKKSSPERIIGITTNGHLLNEAYIEELSKSALDFLQISVNAIDEDSYRSISGGTDFASLEQAILLIDKKNLNRKINLQFSFVAGNADNNFKLKIEKFAQKYQANFFYKQIHNRGGYLYDKPGQTYNSCYIFSQVTYINSDGDILYCCHDLEAKNKIGNILTDSFSDILKRKEKIIEDNNWPKQCDICDDTGRKQLIY